MPQGCGVVSQRAPFCFLSAMLTWQVSDVKRGLEARDSIPADLQFLRFGGCVVRPCLPKHVQTSLPRISRVSDAMCAQLDDDSLLQDYGITDGATLSSQMRLRGGAAQRAKEAAEAAQAKLEMAAEYDSWHKLADKTDESGVMRVLCVSMILDQDRDPVQTDSKFWGDSPSPAVYDGEDENGCSRNGYTEQGAFDEAFKTLMEDFVNNHWDMMKVQKETRFKGKRVYEHQGHDNVLVEIICGDDFTDGLWYKGPLKVSNAHRRREAGLDVAFAIV